FVLEGHDLVELLLDVVEDGGEVVAVELLAALLAELLEEIAEAFQALAERVAHAALEEVAEGVLEVAEVQEVIGEAGEDVVGVKGRDILSAVPFGVAEAVSHAGAIIRDAGGRGCAGRAVTPPRAMPSTQFRTVNHSGFLRGFLIDRRHSCLATDCLSGCFSGYATGCVWAHRVFEKFV